MLGAVIGTQSACDSGGGDEQGAAAASGGSAAGAGAPAGSSATAGTTQSGGAGSPPDDTAGRGGVGGTGGVTAGTNAQPPMAGTGGSDGMSGTGDPGGTGGIGGAGGTEPTSGCTPTPSGTFQTTSELGGPGGNYSIYRPTTLGENGFKHPPVAWGNGLATVPSLYDATLQKVASHGFVVIANPGTGSDPQVVRQGLEWLLEQNGSGMYAGNLAVDCAGTIGYSMGGGAAVGSGAHPAVKAIVSIHGLQNAAENASGPILLLTSDGDTFVPKATHGQPCYDRSTVQPTIMATHVGQPPTPGFGDHLEPLGAGVMDTDPMIAWLRYWLYGDQAQREWFFGTDCKLCVSPWVDIQRKNHTWD
jgi:hypothetical protein